MRKAKLAILGLAIWLLSAGIQPAYAGFSLSVGTDNFYLSVGDYDYLPYAYESRPGYYPPRISFYSALSQYGSWVYVQPFGQVWQPYAGYGWQPYTQGHWVYTQYGPTWVGYEPWAWIGYHYGDWIWSSRFGWVWVPGYQWHPGHVVWAQSYNSIGWMPMPPPGYDYSRGYLAYIGPENQFTYYDDDFGYDYDDYGYGGPNYDRRYQQMYYNPSYLNISINLWVFVDQRHFGYDNYADHCLRGDYSRFVFDRRMVRVSSRPVERTVLERVTRQRISETAVRVRELETDKQKIRVVIPEGEEEQIRKNANRVVREVIAPAFAERQKSFKGERSQNQGGVTRLFHQENVKPKVETVSQETVIRRAQEAKKVRENHSGEMRKKQEADVLRHEKEKISRENQRDPQSDKKSDKPENRVPEKTQGSWNRNESSGTQKTQEPGIVRNEWQFKEPEKQATRDEQFEAKKKYDAPEIPEQRGRVEDSDQNRESVKKPEAVVATIDTDKKEAVVETEDASKEKVESAKEQSEKAKKNSKKSTKKNDSETEKDQGKPDRRR